MIFHLTISGSGCPTTSRPRGSRSSAKRSTSAPAELQRAGKWLHLWRVAGKWANVSIFKVDSPAEYLHQILESLPLYPYMDVEVIALCRHPGSLGDVE